MNNMFCFQCEQTAKGTGCTASGVCGKKPEIAHLQDELCCELISLAQAMRDNAKFCDECLTLITQGLFATLTNVNFDAESLTSYLERAKAKCPHLRKPLPFHANTLFQGETNAVSLRSTLLFGVKGMAAYAHHARVLGKRDAAVDQGMINFLAAVADERSVTDWLNLLMAFGTLNLRCMELLDEANTAAYGDPTPTQVSLTVEKGPFIVVTGHDLRDLAMLLEQSANTGVNIYTHGEMLPGHGYPALKKYPHLKGHFGTAWQNQQREFAQLPGPVLFTTNCLMPVQESYRDRVFTSSVVSWPGAAHIGADADGNKDFSPIINRALALGGYGEDRKLVGPHGGSELTTGFGRKTLLDNADAILDAVKAGAIRHFFLVGGCDGAKPGRSYYTDFVRQTPKDTVVLTLGCGKFRFNDLDAGKIGPFPRILDLGQCNDAYAAVQVALALAGALKCDVNELPLTLVLSWYEQKAVCILLSLLALGIKNIYIGPSLPAFLSPDVVKTLVAQFDLHPLGEPEADMQAMLQ